MSRLFLHGGFVAAGLAAVAALAIGQEAPIGDPMRPALRTPASAADRQSALRLEGIVFSETRRLALIAGEYLKEGDSLFGMRVERIERNAVTVRSDSRTIVLRPQAAPQEVADTAGEPE